MNQEIAPFQYEKDGQIVRKDAEACHSDPFYPRFWPGRLKPKYLKPFIFPIPDDVADKYKSGRPKGVFVCDMSDIFGIGIPEDWTRQVLETIRACPQHRFYLLTKQPQNLTRWSPFPPNCWVGVSVCNDKMLDVAVDKLEDIEAKVKFMSFEPLQKRLTLSLDYAFYYSGVSWLIIGAQTNPYKPPKIEWIQEIVEAADKAGIPVFLKDNIKNILPKTEPFWRKYESPHLDIPGLPGAECWSVDTRYRQELPEVKG
jgi:protein gp37